MAILCKLFGHRPRFGYADVEGQGYFDVRLDAVDGIGRQHARLYCNCQRCGERYQVGMIHVPDLPQQCLPIGKGGGAGSGDKLTYRAHPWAGDACSGTDYTLLLNGKYFATVSTEEQAIQVCAWANGSKS